MAGLLALRLGLLVVFLVITKTHSSFFLKNARCLANCIDEVSLSGSPSDPECTSSKCRECAVPCDKTFVSLGKCISDNCKNSSICENSCQFLKTLQNLTDLENPKNGTAIPPTAAPVVNMTLSNFSALVLSWQPPVNVTDGVVYLLKRRHHGDKLFPYRPELLRKLYTTTTAILPVKDVCSGIRGGNIIKRNFAGPSFWFRVIALTKDSNVSISDESKETKIPKLPSPSIGNTTFRFVIEYHVVRGSSSPYAEKIYLDIEPKTPSNGDFPTTYNAQLRQAGTLDGYMVLSGNFKYNGKNITVYFPDEEVPRGFRITLTVYAMAYCIPSKPHKLIVTYPGCHLVKTFPKIPCIKLDPPRPWPQVRNLAYSPLLPARDYRFSSNFTWLMPLYNYTFQPFTYQMIRVRHIIFCIGQKCFPTVSVPRSTTKETSFLWTNMVPDTKYEFKVSPSNPPDENWRGIVQNFTFRTPAVPVSRTIPLNPNVSFALLKDKGRFNATITWENPPFKYGTIISYTVTYTKGKEEEKTKVVSKGGSSTTTTIEDFDFTESIEFTVKANYKESWIKKVATLQTEKVQSNAPDAQPNEVMVKGLNASTSPKSFTENKAENLYTWEAKWEPPSLRTRQVRHYRVSYRLSGYKEIDCPYGHNSSECPLDDITENPSFRIPGLRPKEHFYLEVTPVFNATLLQGQMQKVESDAPAPDDTLVKPRNLTYNETFNATIFVWLPPTFQHSEVKEYKIRYELTKIESKKRRKRAVGDNNTYVGTTESTNFQAPPVTLGSSLEFEVTPVFNVKVVDGKTESKTIKRPFPTPESDDGWGPGEIAGLVIGILAILLLMLLLWGLLIRKKREERVKKGLHPRAGLGGMIDHWEVPRDKVLLVDELGEGAFGKVYRGYLFEFPEQSSSYSVSNRRKSVKSINHEDGTEVAIKMLHDMADDDQRSEFLKEILLMKDVGSHRNIVNMLGCCTLTEPMFLIVEYLPYGDLLHYLRKRRGKVNQFPDNDTRGPYHSTYCQTIFGPGGPKDFPTIEKTKGDRVYFNSAEEQIEIRNGVAVIAYKENENDAPPEYQNTSSSSSNEGFEGADLYVVDEDDILTSADLMAFAWQVSQGMEYLAKRGYVHRDLAARNVLVGDNKVAKVADFGLTRHMYEDLYQGKTSRKLPLKWMSVEAIFDQTFTSQSDVWAYGVFLWELVTMGGTPYPTINNRELLKLLKEGYRMERPETCSDEMYDIMTKCWEEDPTHRPTFSTLRDYLEELMMQDSPYFDPSCLDESRDYYNVPSFNSAPEPDEDDDVLEELQRNQEEEDTDDNGNVVEEKPDGVEKVDNETGEVIPLETKEGGFYPNNDTHEDGMGDLPDISGYGELNAARKSIQYADIDFGELEAQLYRKRNSLGGFIG